MSGRSDGARPCPACGDAGPGNLVHRLVLRGPDGHPLRAGYPVACCRSCGCGYADAQVDAGYYARYYAETAKYAGEASAPPGASPTSAHGALLGGGGEGGVAEGAAVPGGGVDPDPPWIKEKADGAAAHLAALFPDTATPILDVGCGTGALLGALARRGYTDLSGVDPSPASVAIVASRPGVRAYVGDATAIPTEVGELGCVCMTGVLEHLFDPLAALEAARSRLRTGGVVQVTVPDASCYLDPYAAPFEDFNTEHVNHFSKACLERLGARAGLELLDIGRFDAALAPGVEVAHAVVTWRVAASPVVPDGTGKRSPRRGVGAGGASAGRTTPRRDDTLEAVLSRYTARSLADLARVDARLDEALGKEQEFGLWGVGEAAFKLLALPALASRRLTVLVDGNPARAGIRIGGVPVGAPAVIAPGGPPIVVASFLRGGAILEAGARMGIADRLVAAGGAPGR